MANIKFTALKNNRVATGGLGSVISLVDNKFDIDDNLLGRVIFLCCISALRNI